MDKGILVFIRGVKGRGKEVIKVLEDLGGENQFEYSGDATDGLYIIDQAGIINAFYTMQDAYEIIERIGEELFLPKEKLLNWDNIKCSEGYFLDANTIKFQPKTIGVKELFATEQQAKSAQAAAMISQIREQGKENYGEIVPIGKMATVIFANRRNAVVIENGFSLSGGLLRFETIEQAKLFLDNNRELVEEYLKTF